MDRYESLIENSTGKTPSSRGLSMGSESLVRQSVDTAIRLISANDETRWSIAVSGDKALKREELRPVDTALRAPAARLPSEGPMHGHPRANDTGTRLATDAYDRIAQLVLGRARREGELFDVPAALERPMARLLLDTAELRSRYRAAVDTVLDVIRDGRLAELVDTLRKFGRVSMPDDGRILAHGRASGHEIGDEWWEDDIRDESPRTPLAEHYEHRLRQLIGMIPEIWAGIFLGMGITSENHGPDLVGLSEDGKPLHVEVKTGGRSIALPLRQAERFARIPHAYYLLVFHGEESP